MKKFISKTVFFLIPILLLFIITQLFFSKSESPDLLRLGYFPNIEKRYRSVFEEEFKRKTYYYEFLNNKNRKAKIFTIGDSFTEQDNFGYKNYLAEEYSVLNFNRFIFDNQIQTLYQLLNSSFFEDRKVEYVILENVERHFVHNVIRLDSLKIKEEFQFNGFLKNQKVIKDKNEESFFSKKIIYFPLSMLRYYFGHDYLSNDLIYNYNLSSNKLFSNNSNKLLFLSEDLWGLKFNNDLNEVKKMNDVLNDLSTKLHNKGLKLIVLPAPDKYDLYYDYVVDKTNFPKPLFFEHLQSLKKNYLYIDTKKILSAELHRRKDIYFYDDSHWSPNASKIVSKEIIKIIRHWD